MRLAGSNGEVTDKAIRKVAVEVFAKHGFQAASLRLIAKGVGIQAPSVYNYYSSKEQLLFELLREPVTALIDAYDAGAVDMPDPLERLLFYLSNHLSHHLDFRLEVFIGNMELRNLTAPHYKAITKLRDAYSNKLTGIIEDGVKLGAFQVEDIRVTTFALLAMISGVCNWYRPDGPLSKEKVIDIHTKLALEMLGLGPDRATAASQGKVSKPAKAAAAKKAPRKHATAS